MPDTSEWVERYLAPRLDRLRRGNDLTVEMLRRSRDCIDLSLCLLKVAVPKVWPEPASVDRDPDLP